MKNIHFDHISNYSFFHPMKRHREISSINSLEIFTEKEANAEESSGSMGCIPNMVSRIQDSRFLLVACGLILMTQSLIYWLTSNKSVPLFEISLLHIKKKKKQNTSMSFVKLRSDDQNHCIIRCCLWILGHFIWIFCFLFFSHIYLKVEWITRYAWVGMAVII